MKKLSLLISLVLLVTVGGVYATWNYAHGTAVSASKYFDAVTVVAPMVETNSKGIIEVDTSNLSIVVDDTNNDFKGELVITGEVTVTFTPNDGVTTEVGTDGIKMQYELSATDNFKYNTNDIFTIDKTVKTTDAATKSFTISADELKSLITLNEVTLPTAETYGEFKDALHSGSIVLKVSEAV